MFRIDDATAATALPTPEAAGTEGYFTEGNPTAGTPATNVRGSWLNMIQEELRAIVVAGGLTPSKTTYNQVLSAIKRIGQNTVILADTGAANAYAAANATPLVAGTWVDGVVQQVKIAHANTGASTYSPDGLTAIPIYGLGLQQLQGGELALNGTAVLMRATVAGVNSGNPIAVLMECPGGAQQIAPATQPQHAMQLGQSTGRLLNVQYIRSSGTYTPTLGTKTAVIEGVGGGGGGGGTPNPGTGNAAAGGGGSSGAWGRITIANPVATSVTIGAGGNGIVGSGGGGGGTTSFGTSLILPGGGGAPSAIITSTASVTGGVGAISSAPSGGDINYRGDAGSPGFVLSASSGTGGNGSRSHLGAGGLLAATNSVGSAFSGNAAQGYGSGGGGGIALGASSTSAGGAGAPGIIIVTEYS